MTHFFYILAWVFAILFTLITVYQIYWFVTLSAWEQKFAQLSLKPILTALISWVYILAGPN